MTDGVEVVGFAVGLVGLVPTGILAWDRLHDRWPSRRVLGLRSPHGTEIVVTTSTTGASPVGPPHQAHAVRSLIPSGDLAGVAEICGLLSRTYRGRPYVITSSASQQDDRRRDQILVGGPVHNRYTERLVCGAMDEAGPEVPFVFDADRRYVRLGTKEWGPKLDLRFDGNLVPQVEYAFVLLSEISRFGTTQRVVATGGLTTYGTVAGAHFVSHHLPSYARAQRMGRSPNVAIVVRASMVNGQPYDLRALHWIRIDEPGTRPD